MPLVKLQFRPGIDREGTNYENTQGWFDGNFVRFRMGQPERWGGWEKESANTFTGTCRVLHPWTTLANDNLIGVGTHVKYYINQGGSFNDITPIRASSAINNDPFSITAGSAVVTVTDTSHGALIGDYVTFSGATSSDGTLTATVMNAEYPIDSVTDANTYVVTMSAAATGTDSTEGGASVNAEYQISVGLNTSVPGAGWGAGTWGSDGWGDPASTTAGVSRLRLWPTANFGEDLLFCVRNGAGYQWDATNGVSTRAVALTGLSGASDVPTIMRELLVSPEDRHVLALACDAIDGGGAQDLMLIRWPDSESLVDWTPSTSNSARSLRLSHGSQIITGLITKREILVWTDTSLNSVQFTGPPFTFGTRVVGTNTTIVAPMTAIEADNIVYWMGRDNFYIYDGTVKPLSCTVRSFVFDDMNLDENEKFHVGINKGDYEIIWSYCSASAAEIDRYVVYNYQQDIWYFGGWVRTAYMDRTFTTYPIAAANDGSLYLHEKGLDDGESDPAVAINAYIESSDFEIGEGGGYMFNFIRRLLPDLTFENSTADSPAVVITLTPTDYPGEAYKTADASTITRTGASPETFTKHAHIRLRGRAFKYKIENTATGVFWRDGTPRVEARPDGRR